MCTCVEPLYQPLAAMFASRFSGTVSVVTSFGLMSTAVFSGQNSKPFTATSSVLPAGSATVN